MRVTLIISLMMWFFNCHAHSVEQMSLHWLSELSPTIINELSSEKPPEILQVYQHQDVSIRGFVYRAKNGKVVLAAEPDLKTCCVANQGTIIRQVILQGDGLDDLAFSNDGRVKEIQGRFEIEPLKDGNGDWEQIFVLHDAIIIEKNNQKKQLLIYFILIGVFIIACFLFFKWQTSGNTKSKNTEKRSLEVMGGE